MSTQNRPEDPGEQANAALDARLNQLKSRLGREDIRKSQQVERSSSGKMEMAQGLKLGAEFVSGILVGAGLGYVIDGWLGTSPFGLILFLLLGFAAGVMNVLRSIGLVEKPFEKPRDGSTKG
ncbi:MAG: AtpZ/AtpI family protein [Hyphomicrobiales bacterium]